jgi:chromosome segregation ATPase
VEAGEQMTTQEQTYFPIQVNINLNKETLNLIQQSQGVQLSIAIDSPEQYTTAGAELAKIKALAKSIEAERQALKAPVIDAGREIDRFFKTYLDQLANAEKSIKGAILNFDREQERIRIEAQRLADEQARKEREKAEAQARKEREKAEAERQRLQSIEDDRERAKAMAKIEKSEAKAEAVEAMASHVVAPVIQTAAPKIQGMSKRETWSAEVTDIIKLCKAVADGIVPATAVTANMPYLNKRATMEKSDMAIPGVKATMTESISSRAASW